MVYAVLRTGGKQHRVSVGDRFNVEKLPVSEGETIELNEVLAVGDGENLQVGTPVLEGAKVICEVLEQGRARKILVGKYKRRKGYYRRKGHRQSFTRLRVESILAEGIEVTAPKPEDSQEGPEDSVEETQETAAVEDTVTTTSEEKGETVETQDESSSSTNEEDSPDGSEPDEET